MLLFSVSSLLIEQLASSRSLSAQRRSVNNMIINAPLYRIVDTFSLARSLAFSRNLIIPFGYGKRIKDQFSMRCFDAHCSQLFNIIIILSPYLSHSPSLAHTTHTAFSDCCIRSILMYFVDHFFPSTSNTARERERECKE